MAHGIINGYKKDDSMSLFQRHSDLWKIALQYSVLFLVVNTEVNQ